MNTLEVRIARKIREADGIVSFELVATDGAPLPTFTAGSHVDVHVADGIVRQYSVYSLPEDGACYRIAVLRDPKSRGGSIAMHDRLQEGDVIRISAPKNLFPLKEGRRSLLFAGGIGITPILCMAKSLSRHGADFELHYCARSRERMAFVEHIAASDFADRVHFHVDDGPAEQRLDLAAVLGKAEDGKHLYVCGPEGFIAFVTGTAKQQGWSDEHVHLERFGAQLQENGDDVPFEVRISSTGQSFTVPPDKSVLKVLEENGIDIPVSCEQGVCGTCITRVLEGIPDHRDMYFTDEEKEKNDQFTPCCSRAKTPVLVLDV